MVGIAQLVEHLVVVQGVAGSSPVTHPKNARRTSMYEMDATTFETLVVEELDALPNEMVDGLENVVFVVEDRPEDGSLDLLGIYEGWALTERDRYGTGELPDRIIVYREPHLASCDTDGELRAEVHATLVHEIAHFYGIDDERLHELGWA
jgi:predicted Zn-dependent protease with MMP-like domain